MEVLIMSKTKDFYFQGFNNPNTTPVPDVLFDLLAPELAEAELRVLLYIIRRTYGFKKSSDDISIKQLVEGIRTREGRVLDRGAGVSRPAATKAVKGLVAKGIITSRRNRSAARGDEPTTYTLRFTGDPELSSLTRGGIPNLHGGVNELNPQETDLQETEKQDVVVVAREALKDFGLSDAVASELASTYPEAYILAKLDLVRWLVENNSALVSKNPAGYLRRAIEQDYIPPPKYQTPDQRRAVAEAKEAAITAEQKERRHAELEFAEEQAQQEHALRGLYPPHPIPGTDRTTAEVWDETLALLRAQVVGLAFVMFIQNTVLTQCDSGHATIVTPSRYNAERLATRHDPLIQQTLGQVLGQPVRCAYVSRSEALANTEDRSPSVFPQGEGEHRPLNV
jgi:hypothetical protein